MRLLLLSLLAWGAHAQFIGHRSVLQAYSPARGEFPVRSELAQGYLRYLDNTGAERLVAYAYPEPLYGIRTEHHVLQQPNEQVSSALRSSFVETQASHKTAEPVQTPEVQQARDEHLRIWKEAAQAAQAAPVTLKELKPQQIAITPNYIAQSPPAPVEETQEVYRARQEHLRLYNEALQLQSQSATGKVEGQAVKAITYQNIEQPQVTQPLVPQPVEETPEVKLAREEHLRQYNEAILRQTAEAAAIPQQQAFSSSSETKTGIVELYSPLKTADPQLQALPIANAPLPLSHIKSAITSDAQSIGNIANPASLAPTAPQTTLNTRSSFGDEIKPITNALSNVQPAALPVAQFVRLPVAQIATHEQQIEFLNKAKLTAVDRVADIEDKIRLEERERETERLRDLEQRREEQKQAELERQREEQRLIEERSQLEAERVALQQQEQQRLESERQEELKRLQTEQQLELQQREQQQQAQQQQELQQQFKTNVEHIFKAPATAPAKPQPAAVQPQTISQQQQVQNGFFLRIQAAQPAAAGAAGTPAGTGTGTSAEEVNSSAYLLAEQTHNPFLLRYIQKSISEPVPTGFQAAQIAPNAIPTSRPLPDGLSQLEKSYREHFETHLKALEQLRLERKHSPVAAPCQ